MPKENEIEFDFFDIDKTRLDTEWIKQPRLFFVYAKQLADAKRRLEEARAEADVVKAEVDLEIRGTPENFGFKDMKITEVLITTTINQNGRYQKAAKLIRIRKHKVDILQAAVTALEHRKSALEKLVSLHGQNYFSTPTTTDNVSQETVEEIKDQGRRKRRERNYDKEGIKPRDRK